ncbi:type 2 lantipeptide synthetase LanM [Corynebacterium diphtheriae]|uniref:type 2 lanthipeptide synthetase LanM n=1 Tax=Corynebacterium diphtheriae TaxID=1717 RepID=UPI0008FADF5D|nr:type 2 lanthipeptide synthetase LanM [Corynebacterium diphtheriae]OIR98966.1 lantibiotic-modifying protein [Corynebacterium diphtheriae]OIS18734.1 lantibiotic-modifying protein [Corynebacterium diphtheriae]CAB0897216.1 type 2 lantipeptide synthetase LanM [Corynebacterium diphtheriae]CAB0944115.1 type 2 lantipeptide synthetase LanM [Corynebacterium diphtheriae]
MLVGSIRKFFPEITDDLFQELLTSAAYEHGVASLQGEIEKFTQKNSETDEEVLADNLAELYRFFEREPIPFLDSTWALSDLQISSIRDVIDAFPHRIDCDAVIKSFVSANCSALQRLLLRCQLEFVEKEISSNGPELTYEESSQALFRSLAQFKERYPIAWYLANRKCERSLRYLSEILDHLKEDWSRLSRFGLTEDSQVSNITFELGDTHDGKSVAVVTLDDGQQIFHKPRPLDVEESCSRFAEQLGRMFGFTCPFVGKVITRGSYGWAEHVPHVEESRFDNPRAAAEFALLLKLLSFTAVHYENVRFSADGIPILVDAETALTSGLCRRDSEGIPIHAALSETVTSTGFFPSPLVIPKKRGETFVDVGVLGRRDKNLITERQLVLKNPFTNKMHLVYEDVAKHMSDNASSFRFSSDYVRSLTERYRELTKAVVDKKASISNLLRECFSKSCFRVVVQDTIKYVNAIQLATNQQCLSSPSLYVGALLRFAIGRFDSDRLLLRNELASLISGDIPRYVVSATSSDLEGSVQTVKKNYFIESPIENAIGCVQKMDSKTIELDCWLIEISFASYYDESSNATQFKYSDSLSNVSHNIEVSLNEALTSLLNGYVYGSGSAPATWIGARLSNQAHQYWYVDEVSMDLYAGSSGLALPLVLSGPAGLSCRGRKEAHDYFDGLVTKLESLDTTQLATLNTGALSGAHSVLWSLHCHYSAAGDNGGLERLKSLANKMISCASHDGFDFTGGTIGLSVLAKALGVFESTKIEDDYLNALDSLAESTSRGCSWLSGYAHGHAGALASAAMLCDHISNRDRLESSVSRLFSQFLSFRESESRLWPIGFEQTGIGRGWCSGTPGVLLALAQFHESELGKCYELAPTIEFLTDVVKKETFGGNPTLCHGDVGNLWILQKVGELIGDHALVTRSREAGLFWLQNVLPSFLRSLSRFSISHSLFAGIAGTALYGEYLLSSEEVVRCPLWLE